MFFKSSVRLLVYSSVLFLVKQSVHSSSQRVKRASPTFEPRCRKHNTAIDHVYDYNYMNTTATSRRKRYVLFPEFENYLNDNRYIHRTHDMSYWISNFYPDRISTDYIQQCIIDIIQKINKVIDKAIIPRNAADPGDAKFQYMFFDYTVCPTDDVPRAKVDDVKLFNELAIYPVELTRKSRYRAHGGIHILANDVLMSEIKFNMQQTFLEATDWIYDPVVYTCNDTANECELDTHYVLFHETLHGFGIEHTTNAQNPVPPNPHVQSLMHFSYLRFLCHDDIRAIRAVFELPVIRDHVAYDDTCRRDFPMSTLQKLMRLLHRYLTDLLLYSSIVSTSAFVLTLIYLLVRYCCRSKFDRLQKQTSTLSTDSWHAKDKKPMVRSKQNIKRHGYLWHDEML